MIRRVVVLALFLCFVVSVAVGVKALFGEGESSAASQTSAPPTIASVPSSDSGATTVATIGPDTSTAPGDTTTTTMAVSTSSDPGRVPTAADPARVLLLGDSEAGGLSPFLERVLDGTGVVAMSLDYTVSSGLVRPDFFDWPAHLGATVPIANPDIVVALFGGNDGQNFPNTSFAVDSPEWRAEYGRRVAEVMEYLSGDGRTLIWVGVPNGESDSFTARLKVQNEVVASEVAKHPDVVFVDAWNLFTGIDGGFAPLIEDPRDGVFKPVRSETDGFHLNTVGEEILAFVTGNAVIAELAERGAVL